MNKDHKFLLVEYDGWPYLELIIFPGIIKHSTMADLPGIKRVGAAGFVNTKKTGCYGQSDSLGIDSMPEWSTPVLRKLFEKE